MFLSSYSQSVELKREREREKERLTSHFATGDFAKARRNFVLACCFQNSAAEYFWIGSVVCTRVHLCSSDDFSVTSDDFCQKNV